MIVKREGTGWSRKTFLISLTAAVFGALYLANDTFIMHRVIVYRDSFTAVSVYLVFGAWVGLICMLIYNSLFGKWIDNDYPGFNFGTRKMETFALISGAIAAGSTAFCLMGNQSLDPSLVTALSNLSIIYLVGYDSLRRNISFKNIVVPMSLVVLGSALASITKISGGFEITLAGILILLIGRCGTDAVEKIVRQQGVWKSDAITFNFWRFLWLAVFGTIFSLLVAFARGSINELLTLFLQIWKSALPWILLTMFFVFFFSTLLQKAMKTGAISKVTLVVNFQIALGIPLTLLLNQIAPGVFGNISQETAVWVVRSVGALMIVFGIYYLRNKKSS